jgi:signal transduction histidine kinase
MARLRAGQEIDLAAEAPVPQAGAHGDDEVGQVAEALAVVQRAALEAAVERAEVVSGVAGVFLNLARRSQTLVHRQLALLETMERRVDDPSELEDLFRLDHLATRMRRHAEGLIILSGSPPGRGWRHPVPLMDVLRAAAAEVEDFARVDVRRMPPVAVAGGAVADLTHLIAELVENATTFSPPHSRVVVRGERLGGGGCLIEVEDRGLGMSGSALADANRRIADARPDDLFESDRLGLYVVSRLARRHGVEVLLRAGAGAGADPAANGSGGRGTVAVLMIPEPLLAAAGAGTEPAVDSEVDPGADQGDDQDPGSGTTAEPAALRSIDDRRPNQTAAPGGPAGTFSEQRAFVPSSDHSNREPSWATAPRPVHENGLPRRIRQASLATQLRTRKPAEQGPDPHADIAPNRSPDTVRATMSALQRGWTRGRGTPPMEDE